MGDGNRTKKAVGLIQQPSFFDMAVSKNGFDVRYHNRRKTPSFSSGDTALALDSYVVLETWRAPCEHKAGKKVCPKFSEIDSVYDLRGLSQALNFGKSTMDNGFGMFRTALQYKLAEQGKHLIFIDKWYPSSKTCSHCGGYFGELKLGQEEWVCPHCRKVIPRDKNAGINIKREGIRQFYADRAEASKPAV